MDAKIALYPGTFDPITNGHISLIERGLKVFDRILVAVAADTPKETLFTLEERVEMVRLALKEEKRISVESYTGLTVDYALQRKSCALLRGLRAVSDFEYEFQLALMNRRLQHDLETVFLMTDYRWFYISSTIVKGAASQGGSVEGLVPEIVRLQLEEKFKEAYQRAQSRVSGFKLKPDQLHDANLC